MFHSYELNGSIRPLQDWVILRPLPTAREQMKGGILLPEKVSAHEYGRCEVMAVGPGVRGIFGALKATELKVGQLVFIQKFVEGEFKFRLNGQVVFAIKERYLNVTIEEETLIAKHPAKPRKAVDSVLV